MIEENADVNKIDWYGKTVLHCVMELFNKAPDKFSMIVEILMDNGAKANMKDSDEWTPLHTAVREGQTEGVAVIAKLVTEGAKFDINAVGGA